MVIVTIDKMRKSTGSFFSAETFSKNELTFSIFTIFFEKYFIRTNVNRDLYFDVVCSQPLHEALPRNAEFEQNILFLDVSGFLSHQILECLDVILKTLGIARILNIAECCFFEFILFTNYCITFLLSQM